MWARGVVRASLPASGVASRPTGVSVNERILRLNPRNPRRARTPVGCRRDAYTPPWVAGKARAVDKPSSTGCAPHCLGETPATRKREAGAKGVRPLLPPTPPTARRDIASRPGCVQGHKGCHASALPRPPTAGDLRRRACAPLNGQLPACDPGVPRCDPGVPRCDPGVPRCDPAVPRCDPAVPRREPAVSRREPAVSRCDPTVSRCTTDQ
jgi:hypothetical protein